MSDDALERLRKRAKPNVPSRDSSLISGSQDISIPRKQDIKPSAGQTELFKAKQSTLRLEAELSDRLQNVCRANGISREVLIEALFQYYEGHAESQQEVLAEAQRRNEHRQQVANFRRARSMMQHFEDQRE